MNHDLASIFVEKDLPQAGIGEHAYLKVHLIPESLSPDTDYKVKISSIDQPALFDTRNNFV